MSGKIITKGFIAEGMTCTSCEKVIERQAFKVKGVKSIKIDYSTQEGTVTFDSARTDIDTILSRIEEKGYTCYILKEPGQSGQSSNSSNPLGWVFWLIGLFIAGYFILKLVEGINLPEISQNMGYGLLFVVGLLTGFHCVAMCGGFVVSYTAKDAKEGRKPHMSHFMYGLGKVISYTVIGALFGLLGSIIAFTPFMRGVAGVIAGLFLILFGLNMLNVFPALRKIQFRTPKFIAKFVGEETRESSSPLVIGLLNGLMIACGPLQAMYVMAAGTGSMIEGAKLLFVFGLGTLPVMLGFGYLTTFISSKMTHKILKASGIIVIILGAIMLNRGLALAGTGYDFGSILAAVSISQGGLDSGADSSGTNNLNNIAVQKDGYQEIRMDVTARGWEPDKFVLKTGVPVRWIINGKLITGCNNAIIVPKYGLNFKIKPGEQVIEFTPTASGTIPWSCWMGMIRGTFIVKDDITNSADVQKELNTVQTPKGGSCGMAGGSCSCGGAR
ncbi:hypothetical protein COV19_00265 [Candidatus Woesearchaeota archaeon CG10_big_fil_rev_8_21_14_0_10_44_13]|nr:MAG: hypothetical protein COV19_00265 [Candidatus Woesearchaeota archaeon CG10_big_fil_rev_8_21_14_0_10_44_13]